MGETGFMEHQLALSVRQEDGVRDYENQIRAAKYGNPALSLPRSISHEGALGRSIAFAQFVATWSKFCSHRRVHSTLSKDNGDDVAKYSSRLHGLTAAYYADRFTGKDGKTDLRRAILKASTPRIHAMSQRRYADTAAGLLTELIYFHNAKSQFHSATYRSTPTLTDLMDPEVHGRLIVSAREMNSLASNVLATQNLPDTDWKRIEHLCDQQNGAIGALLHETFRNTAEHAYLDREGRIPARGLRCIVIAARRSRPETLNAHKLTSTDHPNVKAYFSGLDERAKRGRRELAYVLELSILDTGPGFSATIADRVSQETTDAEKVSACFEKGYSNKIGMNSGHGLQCVLAHVHRLRGFLRIRTSSTEAFYSHLSHSSESRQLPHVVSDLPEVVGTAITIALPLEA